MIRNDKIKKTKDGGNARVADSVLSNLVGYQIRRASLVIQADLAHTLKVFDLRMITFSILSVISENPGLRQSQLAEVLDIERSNLVGIIRELRMRGLIICERNSSDRRANSLKLTRAGRHLLNNAISAVRAHETKILRKIDPTSIETAVNTMKKIRNSGR